MGTGLVSLIGAGPGDADLLTLKALRRLEAADLVLHDALVEREALALASRASFVDVGKRRGRVSMPQETIHRIMIQSARRGERVVRLKGGDPFVLGRGGEEALALASAGVAFEIVPGVTSAVAAPALSGIPVTHRGLTSAFLVVSGHAETAYRPVLAAVAPGSVTLVVLMGLESRRDLAAFLIDRGWTESTPAATIVGASTPRSATSIATLFDWLEDEPEPREDPGTLVIGDVVSLAERIAVDIPHVSFTAGTEGAKGAIA